MQIVYVNTSGITNLQRNIMVYIGDRAHKEKTPIPRSLIIKEMSDRQVKTFTAINALNSLLKKGYIREAVTISNKTYYVQLRSV